MTKTTGEYDTRPRTEVAFVFTDTGEVIHWHLPEGSTYYKIPDTRSLWEVLWENRDRVCGVAHIHPWYSPSGPSSTDVSTFEAIEAGLGQRLIWPVITMDQQAFFRYYEGNGIRSGYYMTDHRLKDSDNWNAAVAKIRRLAKGE